MMTGFSLKLPFLFFTAASCQETSRFVGFLVSLSRVIMPIVKSHWSSNTSDIVKIQLQISSDWLWFYCFRFCVALEQKNWKVGVIIGQIKGGAVFKAVEHLSPLPPPLPLQMKSICGPMCDSAFFDSICLQSERVCDFIVVTGWEEPAISNNTGLKQFGL